MLLFILRKISDKQKHMNSRSILLLFCAVLLGIGTNAQKKQLSVEDYMNPALYPKRMYNLQWVADTKNYTYIDYKSGTIVQSGIKSKNTDTILSVDDLNNALESIGADKLRSVPSFKWTSENEIRFTNSNTVYYYNLKESKISKGNFWNKKAANTELAPKTDIAAFTLGNNLFVSIEGEEFSVTGDKNEDIVNGQTVHRSEFGIHKGTFWSPNGDLLAFYRKDESKVKNYPLVDISTRIAEVSNTKYAMAGTESEEVTVGVYNTTTKKTVFLKTGKPADQYLTNITWSPDQNHIYISVLNREQKHLKLNKYDAQTGELVLTLFEEKHEKYVEPENGLTFMKNNPGQFIWNSERDGFNHLYIYSTEGKLIKQLTKGDWLVTGIIGFDKKGKNLLFTSTKNSPLNNDIFSVNLKSGSIKELSNHGGQHSAIFNGTYIIDAYTSTEIAREYSIIDLKGKVKKSIMKDENPAAGYELGETTVFTIKAKDNTDLFCRMIKPTNFDENKKYPVLVYVYGGPHAQLVTNSYLSGAGMFLNYMASQGYVVFTMDSRGSANRGFKFESAIYRNLGTIEVSDQMDGIEYLKGLSFVDANRIGVDGWSYGGFMSISMMLKNPGTFKAACAGGPVIDWKYYEIMYGERYMDTPQDNENGYAEANLLNHVKDLDGRLMIIHGAMDPVVVWQHSLAFVEKCVKEGKLLDYFVYPGHEHNVRGKDRIHLYRKIEQFFKENL